MTWADLDPEQQQNLIWQVAEQVCTDKELAALKFWNAGWTYREMAPMLGVKYATAWETVKRGLGRIAKRMDELEREVAA
jgi:DNA-directed RNA polymerase specialized sigma24 family protein